MESTSVNELLICRGCLSTDRKFYNINKREFLLEYCILTGSQLTECDGLPHYLCYICIALVHKFVQFRDQCLQSKKYLENIKKPSRIQLKQLKVHSNTFYQHTKTEIHDYQPDDFNTQITNETSILSDNKTNIKIKEDIDDTKDLQVKDENTNFSQNSNQYESEIQFLVNDYTNIVKDDSDSDNQALVIFKTNNKQKKKGQTLKKIYKNKSDDAVISQNGKKRFETAENLADFERLYSVDIMVLSKDEQLQDVLERKCGVNYLHSPYKCDLCYKGYMDGENLKKHYMAQHDDSCGAVVCEFCKFRYKDKRGLNQHLKKHRLKFACRLCKYVSRTTFNAKEHHKMHGGNIHKCKQCGKCYEKLSSYLSHMRIHHPSELVWCEFCGEAFIGEFGLNGHKKRAHRNLKFPQEALCLPCKTNFTSREALDKHTNRQTNGICDISCVHCGLCFGTRLALKDHLLEVHRTKKKYSCEKCTKTFAKESLYSAHYRRMHINGALSKIDKIANWICEVCGKSLPSKCLLVYHQRNHTGEKPYQCKECTKTFTMKKLLQSHMRVHTSARPYSCNTCPKTFKGLSALRSHENIHGVKNKLSGNIRL